MNCPTRLCRAGRRPLPKEKQMPVWRHSGIQAPGTDGEAFDHMDPARLRRTHIVAMTNQKGGCGKTTATVSLGAALAEDGLSVTVIDTDPQCNATATFGVEDRKSVV